MAFTLPNGEFIVDDNSPNPVSVADRTPVVSDFKSFFDEYAKANGFDYDAEIPLETTDQLADAIYNMRQEKEFGKDNQILKLAKNNVDIGSVAQQIAQYDSLLLNDDKELFLQSKALENATAYRNANPAATNDIIQKVYQDAYNELFKKHENTDTNLFSDLASPFRQKYTAEKEAIIPKSIENANNYKQTQLKKFEENKTELIKGILANPSYAQKEDAELKKFLEDKTALTGNEITFFKEIGSDAKKLARVLELYYLDSTGKLNEAVGGKVLGKSEGAPLFNQSFASGGLRIIDTSKPH